MVVKIEGKHNSIILGRAWLPFVVRLYFYAGSDSVRMVHTFIFDGDQEKDFIRGLGVRFDVPMREEFQNRHVRLAGDQGFFAEPVRSDRRAEKSAIRGCMTRQQIAGKRIPNLDRACRRRATSRPDGGVGFVQADATHAGWIYDSEAHESQKRVDQRRGRQRSLGLAFVGDVSGGLSIDLKNFWQLYPTELEIEGAGTDAAQLTAWLWSPDAPAMDMRHYDTDRARAGSFVRGRSAGIQQRLWRGAHERIDAAAVSAGSERCQDLLQQAQADQQAPLLVCSPEYYHRDSCFRIVEFAGSPRRRASGGWRTSSTRRSRFTRDRSNSGDGMGSGISAM